MSVTRVVAQTKERMESPHAPCPPLYHYTSPSGLLGIVTKQAILASDASCLNDHAELKHVDRIVANVGGKLAVRTEAGRQFRDQIVAGTLRTSFRVGAFVASFSEDPDHLTQWRAYANDGLGYALGFTEAMELSVREPGEDGALARPHPAPLVQVIYDPEKQKDLLRLPAQEIAARLDDFAEVTAPEEATRAVPFAVASLAMIAEHLAPIIKNPGFQEEREWRAFIRFQENLFPGHCLHFRPSRYGITAAVWLGAETNSEHSGLPISEIVLGPKLDPVVAMRTTKYLLRQRSLHLSREDTRPTILMGRGEPIRVWQSATSYR